MAQQGPNFDLSKVSTADRIILGGTVVYFLWVFFPFWYSCCTVLGATVDLGSVNGFRFPIVLSWILALIAIGEIVAARIMGTEFKLPAKRGVIHLGIAGVALFFTLLGLVVKPTGTTLAWGIFLGVLINLVWAYGAYMLYSEPQTG
jgi:hypothetical protein